MGTKIAVCSACSSAFLLKGCIAADVDRAFLLRYTKSIATAAAIKATAPILALIAAGMTEERLLWVVFDEEGSLVFVGSVVGVAVGVMLFLVAVLEDI